MKNKLLILFLLVTPILGLAQKAFKIQKKQKSNSEAYPNPFDFHQTGWLIEGGITGTLGFEQNPTLIQGDTTWSFSTPIRPGAAINIGRYYSMKKFHKVVKYIDYNLGYKMLWNNESQTASIDSTSQTVSFDNNNMVHYASGNINLNNIISLNDYNFIQNTIGINVDYRLASQLNADGLNATEEPSPFVVQVHYKLALGLMIDNDKAIIPYIEIPVFNITPQQSQFSQLDYFNQPFQSFVIGARFMLFTLGQKDCPTAKGSTVNKHQRNGY